MLRSRITKSSRVILCVGGVVAALIGLYATRGVWRGEYLLLHSSSELGRQFELAIALEAPPAPRGQAAEENRATFEAVSKLFRDLYVVKDGATDCSFVAALMLVLRHDPAYPYRVVRIASDLHLVQFPALEQPIAVTAGELRAHRESWERTREWYRRYWPGHIPAGVELLRCAYYNHQARAGIRGEVGTVHGGGVPAQDLLFLSGATRGLSLVAKCDADRAAVSFDGCGSAVVESTLRPDGSLATTTRLLQSEGPDPVEFIESHRQSMLVLSSSDSTPRWPGPHLIPNHAYYYLGTSRDGLHVLGNSYQTRRPITVTSAQLRGYFRAVDAVEPPAGHAVPWLSVLAGFSEPTVDARRWRSPAAPVSPPSAENRVQ